jgi:hypothetical protein
MDYGVIKNNPISKLVIAVSPILAVFEWMGKKT